MLLNKKYNHLEVEKDKYEQWKNQGYFNSDNKSNKEPYCIVIPPPNVTGKLHLGHAWDNTLQDIIARYKRLQGYDVLYLPGMDHAGIATQAKIDERLRNENIKPREMNREDWLKKAWDWKEEYASIIRQQWSKLGLSLDYNKERFTLDEGLNKAVTKVFIDYYNKGLIYKSKKPINWDPVVGTALSNIEVIYKEEQGKMYYLKYMIEGTEDFIEVATTRTETLGADTALVVHPDDERYKDLVGKNVITPLRKEPIPVITDEYIDMEFGSGAMKCSAHAPNDIEILNKNNIKIQECINKDGLLNKNALEFAGMTREEGRIKIADKLKKEGLLIREEDHTHQVGYSERSNTVIETMVMPQWFVKMDELSKQVLDNQKSDNKVNFVPQRFEKIFTNWMENVYDWCISRQLWWGHRIPAWYKDKEIKVQAESPGEGWRQDPDVLDTWFSSALWPMSTLGWPEETEDFKRYFPTNVLVTGYDIIFFWVSRMMFQSLEVTDDIPFNDTLIHGLIRDKDGKKMSKSLNNGIDPMDVIEQYGADSLRYFLTTNSAPGQDLRYDEEKIRSSWNFINKIWNASNFVLMNTEDFIKEEYTLDNLSLQDKWILSKLNKTIKSVKSNMDKYEFGLVGTELNSFIWNDFCDWYIELSKNNINNTTKSVLIKVLKDILVMLNPFMPFVTEEIYNKLPIKEFDSVMEEKFPICEDNLIDEESEGQLNVLITLIKSIRRKKLENNLTNFISYDTSKLNLSGYSQEWKNLFESLVENTLKPSNRTQKGDIFTFKLVPGELTAYYDGSTNQEAEKERTEKEIESLKASIKRRSELLSNKGYVNNAPESLIKSEKEKLADETNRLNSLQNK